MEHIGTILETMSEGLEVEQDIPEELRSTNLSPLLWRKLSIANAEIERLQAENSHLRAKSIILKPIIHE